MHPTILETREPRRKQSPPLFLGCVDAVSGVCISNWHSRACPPTKETRGFMITGWGIMLQGGYHDARREAIVFLSDALVGF